MRLYPIHWLLATACVAGYWDAAIAQVAPATILKIDLENGYTYYNDETNYAKLATSPDRVPPAPTLNFRTGIFIADIVAVNGRAAKGTHLCRDLEIRISVAPTAGQAIGDVEGGADLDCIDHILHPDGTPIGAIAFRGRANLPTPPPGAPLEQSLGSLVVTGGNGAFLGVRGQSGEVALCSGCRGGSVTEDPSKRRLRSGGKVTLIMHLIPMSRPEVFITPAGLAIVHASDFTPVTAARPAKSGEVLTLFASGLGPTRPGVNPGQPFAANPQQVVNSPLDVTVNGKPAEVLYAGGYPGAVDGYQVNFRVPDGTAAGLASIQLISAWITGPDVRMPVQ